MRTLVASAALAVAVAAPAHAGLRDTCWEAGPTFYVSGIVCRVVPDA